MSNLGYLESTLGVTVETVGMSDTKYSYDEEFKTHNQRYILYERSETMDARVADIEFYLSSVKKDFKQRGKEPIDVEEPQVQIEDNFYKNIFEDIATEYESGEYSLYKGYDVLGQTEFELHPRYKGTEYILTMVREGRD